MFSTKEKQFIAAEIEKLLLGMNHPEMPKRCPKFELHVTGEAAWSWADIKPNWTFSEANPPSTNVWNEEARQILKSQSTPLS